MFIFVLCVIILGLQAGEFWESQVKQFQWIML